MTSHLYDMNADKENAAGIQRKKNMYVRLIVHVFHTLSVGAWKEARMLHSTFVRGVHPSAAYLVVLIMAHT